MEEAVKGEIASTREVGESGEYLVAVLHVVFEGMLIKKDNTNLYI
jgi:hypothetical protein